MQSLSWRERDNAPLAKIRTSTQDAFYFGKTNAGYFPMIKTEELQQRLLWYLGTFVALMVPLALFYLLNDRIMKSPMGYDEQTFVWAGWNITQGLRPYIDFYEFKPPIAFITHALAIWTYGDRNMHFRVFFSLFAAISTLAIHVSLLSRRMNRAVSTALVGALVFAWVNPSYHDNALQDTESIGLIYYFLGVAAMIAETGRYRKYFQAIGAFFLACAVLSKEPFAGAVVGTWVTLFFFVHGTANLRTNAIQYVKYTSIGVGTMVLALSAYMVPTGSMRGYFRLLIDYATLFRNPETSYCVLLGRWTPSTPFHELKAQAKYIHAQFFNTATIGYLTPFFVASVVFVWRSSKALFAASLATLLLALYAVTATNCQWLHYYNMSLSGMFLFLIVGADRMNAELFHASPILRRYVGAMLVAVIAIFAYPRSNSELHGWPYHFYPVQSSIPGEFEFVANNSAPGDRILTTGQPFLYVYTHRRSALREVALLDEILMSYPGKTDIERVQGLRDELVKNRPKIIILDPEFGDRKQRHLDALFLPFFRDFGYRKVGDYYYLRPD
jgi:hypothetical protein